LRKNFHNFELINTSAVGKTIDELRGETGSEQSHKFPDGVGH